MTDEQPLHRTDAHALHSILAAVEKSQAKSLHLRWAGVLGAEVNTPEFDRRHAEVVGLYTRILRDIQALPEAQQRIYGPYRHAWWEAVMQPNTAWGSGQNRVVIITREHLHLLHTAGDLIESRLDSTSSAPGATNLDSLREVIDGWVEMLTTEPGMLPNAALRTVLVRQLEHVLWLIENASLFGAGPIASAAQEAVGGIVMASPEVPEPHKRSWKQRAFQALGTLILFNAIGTEATTAIESVGDLAAAMIEAGDKAGDALSD